MKGPGRIVRAPQNRKKLAALTSLISDYKGNTFRVV